MENTIIISDGKTTLQVPYFDFKTHSYDFEKKEVVELSYEEKQKMVELNREQETNSLRSKREKDCFLIINRGQIWYNALTEQQKYELTYWYKQWLDVTTTKQIPAKPSWLS